MIEKHLLYNGEITLEYEDGPHTYKVNGQIVPSATGITDIIAKNLTWWAATEAGKSWVENMTGGVFTVDVDNKQVVRVKDGEIVVPTLDEISLQDFMQKGRFAHRNSKDKAADIGTLVHDYIEKYVKWQLGLDGYPEPALPSNKEAQQSIQAYKAWEKDNRVQYIESETKIYSKKYKYAGTLDILATVNGELAIVDLKTSKGIYPGYWLQTAGYQQAKQEELGWEIKKRYIVRIGKDGALEVEQSQDFDQDFRGFLGALLLSTRIKQIEYQPNKEEPVGTRN